MLLTTVLLLLLLLVMFPVTAGIAERVGGAAALFKVIASSFLVFCHFTQFIVYFPSSRAHFSPIFGYVDPIIVVLNPSFDWFFTFFFFKYLFEEIVDVVFPSISWSSDRSVGPIS